KSDASEGFTQIIDFLSGSYIHYVLTVSPHIYISYIKQFWNTAVVKRSGMVCLPNEEIFAGLAQMGYEKPTSWNEFSTAMASAVICLSKGQRFNFSMYIFDSLVRNVDSSSKFYMYPRFIQLIIQAEVVDLSSHTTPYISPTLTQKVFANMRRVGKGFSGVETPLFENMLEVREVDAEEEVQVPAQDDVDQENVKEEIIKSINETPAQKAAKRRRLREQAKEDENLKKQLEVVVDEDDDVFIEATPIGRKVPVVNYEIVMINNKPRYKIIRADNTHRLYTSFITLLKNFDREDLEDLWKIVKARFSTSKPTNFSNDYLLVTLKTMFEKTDAQDSVSPDYHSSSCGDQAREQGDKAVNKDKGKNPVVTITGFKDLNEEFAECINNRSNGVSAAGPPVSAAGLDFTNSINDFTAASPLVFAAVLNFTNSSNDFSAAGPSNAAMPNLEDLSHNADDVGAEADTNNMESIILVSPIPTTRIYKDHPISQIIGDLSLTTQTRSMARGVRDQDLPYGKRAIGTKWVYRNKKDERGIVVRNKARLVAQGNTQEDGIDYEEVFAQVERIEVVRLFLAYASFMGFPVYQMDVKSTFLYGTIEEKVYVCQPPGFEDPKHPDKVYKVVKALYGLHQAPRTWYETLATYLQENGFQRGTIDQTLFIKKQQKDILLVQIYVDDINIGATNKAMCQSFEKLMKDKFQMSSMRELTFFLGLQVKQKKDAIFISQDKYVAEIL
nr:putative ribonuclease H-like domain-containing protein [Tanacetum cinerariifolium]